MEAKKTVLPAPPLCFHLLPHSHAGYFTAGGLAIGLVLLLKKNTKIKFLESADRGGVLWHLKLTTTWAVAIFSWKIQWLPAAVANPARAKGGGTAHRNLFFPHYLNGNLVLATRPLGGVATLH